MNKKITFFTNQFGLPQAINRPHVPATKQLDLSGPEGQLLIKETTKRVIIKFAHTLTKLEKI
nr:hypothetical protein [uncultured Tolumonas sp.]